MAEPLELGTEPELALFRLMTERIPGVVWAVDVHLRFTASFGKALATLNLTPGQVLGKTVYEYLGTDDDTYLPVAAHLKALQGETTDYDFYWQGRHFEVHLEPVIGPLSQIIGCVGFAQDVTDRKRAEQELRRRDQLEADRQLIRMLESVPEGVIMLDHDWRFKFVSQMAASILKTTPEALSGQRVCDVFPEATQIMARPDFSRAIEQKSSIHFESYYPEPLNLWYECHCHMTPDGVLAYLRDISSRMVAQEALQHEQKALWRMVQASDHERRLITYDLHDRAAQELMGSLMFFLSYEDQKSKSPEEAEASLRAGIAAVQRASAEIRRLISGVRTPVLDRLGIVAAIEDLTHQLQQRPNSPEILFERDVANLRLSPVLENCLYRIAQDLITNASRHSQSDKVWVRLSGTDEHVTLEVRDQGIGFDPKSVSEDWFGLEGVRERARLLGGSSRIQSKLGEGTTVVINIPIVEER